MTRSLPIRLHPRTDESFHGYVARLSYSLSVPTGQILNHLGLLPGERIGWGCLLRDSDVTEVADALSLTEERLQRLTLRRYQHLVRMPNDTQWRSLGGWASTESILLRGGRFCPACLGADGTWRLVWRLPEQIGCRTHHRLLQHRCDGCQGPPSAGGAARAEAGYPDYLHHPRHCYSRDGVRKPADGTHAPPCGRDLSKVPAPRLTEPQERLSGLVARIHDGQTVTLAGRPYPAAAARQVLREAMSLQGHAERQQLPQPRPTARLYRRVVADAEEVDRLLSACSTWLLSPDQNHTVHHLADWLDRASTGTPTWKHIRDQLGTDPALRPQLLEALEQFGRPSSQANRLRTGGAPPPSPYPQQLPQLAWRCALPTALAASSSPHYQYIQVVMSLQLARRNTVTWQQAATVLRVPAAVQWKRNVYTKLGRQQHLRTFLARAAQLHRELLTAPPWTLVTRPEDGTPMSGLTEGVCRHAGAPWCPCLTPEDALSNRSGGKT